MLANKIHLQIKKIKKIRQEIMNKFAKTYTVENMIQSVRDKTQDVAKLFLDFLIILMENKEFRNLFMFLEGHLMIMK